MTVYSGTEWFLIDSETLSSLHFKDKNGNPKRIKKIVDRQKLGGTDMCVVETLEGGRALINESTLEEICMEGQSIFSISKKSHYPFLGITTVSLGLSNKKTIIVDDLTFKPIVTGGIAITKIEKQLTLKYDLTWVRLVSGESVLVNLKTFNKKTLSLTPVTGKKTGSMISRKDLKNIERFGKLELIRVKTSNQEVYININTFDKIASTVEELQRDGEMVIGIKKVKIEHKNGFVTKWSVELENSGHFLADSEYLETITMEGERIRNIQQDYYCKHFYDTSLLFADMEHSGNFFVRALVDSFEFFVLNGERIHPFAYEVKKVKVSSSGYKQRSEIYRFRTEKERHIYVMKNELLKTDDGIFITEETDIEFIGKSEWLRKEVFAISKNDPSFKVRITSPSLIQKK